MSSIQGSSVKGWTKQQTNVCKDVLHISDGKVYYTQEFLAKNFPGISSKNVYTNWTDMFDKKTGIVKEQLVKVCEAGDEIHFTGETTLALGSCDMAYVTLIDLEEANKKILKIEEEP